MDSRGFIVVRRRDGGYRDRLRSYRLEVDRQRRGQLARGQEITVPVHAGVHLVRARIDWAGSPEVEVHVDPGSSVRLLVAPGGNAFQLWQLWQTDRYLELVPE